MELDSYKQAEREQDREKHASSRQAAEARGAGTEDTHAEKLKIR